MFNHFPGHEFRTRHLEKSFAFFTNHQSFLERLKQANRDRFFFHPRNRKDFFLQLLARVQSQECILAEADATARNRFAAFGSGLVELGTSIPWRRDFKSGHEWLEDRPSWHQLVDASHPSDVKVPWELARFNQVWWLGKAFWVTSQEEYARTFERLIRSWIAENPVGEGLHWTTAMEAAIRSCNWIMGFCFFQESPALSAEFWHTFLQSLYQHGCFLERHLEYSNPSGNHLIAGLTGLFMLGLFFRDTHRGVRWLNLARRELEREARNQVSEDGVHFEKSTGYHVLVLEMLTAVHILAMRNQVSFPPALRERLEKMFAFLASCIGPDGGLPDFGDSDNGHLFRYRLLEEGSSASGLLCAGAILFENTSWKATAGPFSETALWLLGGEGFERHLKLPAPGESPSSRLFTQGGFAVLRDERMHVAIRTGDTGVTGKTGHGHDDAFSFELRAGGQAFVTDSGMYTYTSDIPAREYFRSAGAHNGLMLEGRKSVEFGGIWKIKHDFAPPGTPSLSENGGVILLQCRRAFPDGLVHRRQFKLEKGKLHVEDQLAGRGFHRVSGFLHFHPDIRLVLSSSTTASAFHGNTGLQISISNGRFTLTKTPFSPTYGVRTTRPALRIESEFTDDGVIIVEFSLVSD